MDNVLRFPGVHTSQTTNEGLPRHTPLSDFAANIRAHWTKVHVTAKPYLDAMSTLDQITDVYGCDTAQSVVLYFLANAQAFRGDYAKQVKRELKDVLKLLKDERYRELADKNARAVYGL